MTSFLTREPRSREQIAAATDIIRDILGDAALAAYLYGSAVAGGLPPDSDLDILVVSDRSLTGDETAAIIRRLLLISGHRAGGGPARSIELTIIARPAVTPWRYPRASSSSTAAGCAPSSSEVSCPGGVPRRGARGLARAHSAGAPARRPRRPADPYVGADA
jgi:predicted nucleotidyltransferase